MQQSPVSRYKDGQRAVPVLITGSLMGKATRAHPTLKSVVYKRVPVVYEAVCVEFKLLVLVLKEVYTVWHGV